MTAAIQFKLLNKDAQMPRRQTRGSVGFDLHCTHDVFIAPNTRELVSTGVQAIIPEGFAGIIKDRSSMAVKLGARTAGGVIDWDYEGEIKVILFTSTATFMAKKGDRIAQIVFIPVLTKAYEGDLFGETIRGTEGFGSTGQ